MKSYEMMSLARCDNRALIIDICQIVNFLMINKTSVKKGGCAVRVKCMSLHWEKKK